MHVCGGQALTGLYFFKPVQLPWDACGMHGHCDLRYGGRGAAWVRVASVLLASHRTGRADVLLDRQGRIVLAERINCCDCSTASYCSSSAWLP